ncbi:MAG TPA: diguanylate cyclase [Gaiellaceae bacterium]|nr:diguanylate cyclase [Gaiellaceae bacterium]
MRPQRWGQTEALRVWGAVAGAGFAFLFAHLTFGLGGAGLDSFVDRWLYDGLELLAALGCFLRAAWVPGERVAWSVLALGMLSFATGDVIYDFAYSGAPSTPSLADPFYLAFYPSCYVAVVLLVRSRISTFIPSAWLDGLIAALAAASVGAGVLVEVVLHHSTGSRLSVVTDLAYPVGDVVLLAILVFVFAITGWRPGRTWTVVGSAFALITVADSVYLAVNAAGLYDEGTPLDALWPAAMLLLALSAWQGREDRTLANELDGRFLFAAPVVCGVVAVAVLVGSRFDHLNLLAVFLAAGTIVTVLARTVLSFRDNARLLDRARSQSFSDPLTGLANRRKLMLDLERGLVLDDVERPLLLVIFDLNGFKHYNDTFGHPSGDALLIRLAGKLKLASGPHGEAYRLGGDEFCLLLSLPKSDAESQLDAAVRALAEEGDGFGVSAAFGAAFLPEEAIDVSTALRLADQRLYAQKYHLHRGRGESYELLLRAQAEREPGVRDHLRGVAELSVAVGRELGFPADQLEELRLAAELHDVGKLAIPDAVLKKPGPLSEQEWAFIRQHTVIGQRILAGAPSLRRIGEIVRATHERWDGTGYIDGLAGEEIPLPARIIAVCDAFVSMTSDRPHRAAIGFTEAFAELGRCSGTQFDPEIVSIFRSIYSDAWDTHVT